MSQKIFMWLSIAAFPVAVIACTTSSPGDDDGSTGDGGSGASGNTGGVGNTGNTGGVGNTGNTGGSGNTGNTSGTGGCDTGQGMSFDSPECIACIQCTQTADCQTDWSLCTMGQPCGDFITCLDDCDTQCGSDQTCFDTCVGLDTESSTCVATSGCIAASAQGCNDYLTALSCSVCQFCPGDCDAANNCS